MKKCLLILIIILASTLRLVQLANFPAGLNADEAALGYNAYSLFQTGRDEHGHILPVNLESFGDFKPALYTYLLTPFVKVLGLSELAVRLPSALFGIAAVLGVYLLARGLTGNWKIGQLAALVLAISPWHLHFSRGGWEVNVATTLMVFGLWQGVRWIKSGIFLHLASSVLLFVLSMYTYQSARVVAPLLGLGIFLLNFNRFKVRLHQTIKAVGWGLILLIPLVCSLISTGAAARLSGVGLLADEGPLRRAEELRGQHADWSSLSSRLLHNRWLLYSIQFANNYFDHFNGNFLFINGDEIARNKVPEFGLLYLTDAILVIIGVFFFFRFRVYNSRTNLIWWWLLIAPIASAMTFQTPHALRAHNLVVPLTIFAAIGVYSLVQRWKWLTLVLAILYLWQGSLYLHQYYVHYPRTYPEAWQYGFRELVTYVEENKSRYDRILITDKYDQPYILFLFYSKYPPSRFQTNHQLTERDRFNFSTVREYDKYVFGSTVWDKVSDIHPVLVAAAPEDIPEVGVHVVKTIYFPSGDPAFKIISN